MVTSCYPTLPSPSAYPPGSSRQQLSQLTAAPAHLPLDIQQQPIPEEEEFEDLPEEALDWRCELNGSHPDGSASSKPTADEPEELEENTP